MNAALQRFRSRLPGIFAPFRSHPSHSSEIEMLILDALLAIGNELTEIEAALQAETPTDVSTAVSTAVSTTQAADEASASTALSSALSSADASASTAVVSAISQTSADDQAALNAVTSSLSAQTSTIASLAGVSWSLSAVSTSLSASSTSISAVSTSLSPTSVSVSPDTITLPSGQTNSVVLNITGGTPPYSIPGLGVGQSFDPVTSTFNVDATSLPGSGTAEVTDSTGEATPLTVTLT